METHVDYSAPSSWILRPSRAGIEHSVDAFFVYPTVYRHKDPDKHHLMPLDSHWFRLAARAATYRDNRFLAPHCNIFAPYYRQVGMEVLFMRRTRFDHISKVPYHDIRDAFHYYLEHLNGGRPFILAGHSQGSEMLLKLLCHELTDPDILGRLVAAYLIGYSLTRPELAQFRHVRLAQNESDVGCVITYNTSAPGASLLPVVLPGAVAVNPLTWSQSAEYAPPALNEESVFFQAGPLRLSRRHFTGARIDAEQGVVMIDEKAWRRLRCPKTLHSLDIPLFEGNLSRNVAARIASYKAHREPSVLN